MGILTLAVLEVDVGLYAVAMENTQPIEGGRDVQFNLLALVEHLENSVWTTLNNIEVSFCVNIRVLTHTIALPPQALERVGPFAGQHAFGVEVPQPA